MARTRYSETYVKPARPDGVMERSEYLTRARGLASRGQALPQSRLLDMDVVTIRSAKRQRESLLAHIRNNLSNAALARQYGVHPRTIEKVLAGESWSHLP